MGSLGIFARKICVVPQRLGDSWECRPTGRDGTCCVIIASWSISIAARDD